MNRPGLDWALALVALAAGCSGDVGLLSIELVSAPGADPLANARTVRLTATATGHRAEARIEDADSLAIEIDATGVSSSLLFEAEDDEGQLVAIGRTPPVPLSGIDYALRIFVAEPFSVAEAPLALDPPRAELGAAPLAFGAVLAGGVTDDGITLASVLVYNAFQHQFQVGVDLPEPRRLLGTISDTRGLVYLAGGADAEGDPRATVWRFDTGVAPAGAYLTLQASEELARLAPPMASLGRDRYLIAGSAPLVVLDVSARTATAPDELAGLAGVPASFFEGDDLVATALVTGADAGPGFAFLYREGAVTPLDGPPELERSQHRAVPALDRVLVFGGTGPGETPSSSIVLYDPSTRSFEVRGGILEPRSDQAVAVAGRYLVVAGGVGVDDEVSDAVEVLDLETLEVVRTLRLTEARRGAVAVGLGNGQVLIAGGLTADGSVAQSLELFTPGS